MNVYTCYVLCFFNAVFIFQQVVMNIIVAFVLELFLFRILYRRKMHLSDIDGRWIVFC